DGLDFGFFAGDGAVGVGDGGFGDGVDGLQAIEDVSEGGVIVIEGGGFVGHDEELGSGGIERAGAGHGEGAAFVLFVGELVHDFVARSAGAGLGIGVGVAALDHEAGDDAVERGAVVETLAGEGDEIIDGVGGGVIGEFGLDDALVGGDDGDLCEFHVGGSGGE